VALGAEVFGRREQEERNAPSSVLTSWLDDDDDNAELKLSFSFRQSMRSLNFHCSLFPRVL
jgi:hypothetical protein